MNQSLYVAPDNKIVVEDKTTATEFKRLIDKLEHNEFLLSEPDTIEENNLSAKDTRQEEIPEIETNLSVSTVADIKLPEVNQTQNEQEVLIPAVEEENLSKEETNATQIPEKPAEPAITSVKEETPPPPQQIFLEEKVVHTTAEKTTLQEYPAHYKSAEEKVQAILRQMRQH